MIVRVLGSAAGGGSPQWNCVCAVCQGVRQGRGPTRLTSAFALTGPRESTYLINASPDVGVQLRQYGFGGSARPNPDGIDGVLLTDSELDHTAGLLSLREATRLRLYGTPSIKRLVTESGVLSTLACYTEVEWIDVVIGEPLVLPVRGTESANGTDPDAPHLTVLAIPLGTGKRPRFAQETDAGAQAVVGYIVTDSTTGRSAAFAPCLTSEDDATVKRLATAAYAFIDGTFHTEDELALNGSMRGGSRSLGHLPVGSSDLGARISASGCRVIYTHLNNTNPMCIPTSPESVRLRAAGFAIAMDQLEVTV